MTLGKVLRGVLGNRCPRCGKGKVFRGLYSMNAVCPSCGTKFDREPGFFLGALVLGYFFSAFSTVPTLVICIFVLQVPLVAAIAITCAQIILLNPLIFRLGRLTWLYL